MPTLDGPLDAVVILLLALASRLVAPIGDASAVGAMQWTLFATIQAFLGQSVPAAIGLWATVARAGEHRSDRLAPVAPGPGVAAPPFPAPGGAGPSHD